LVLDDPGRPDQARKDEILPYLERLRDEPVADDLCQPFPRRGRALADHWS